MKPFDEIEIRRLALEELARDRGPLHTGELAARLGVPTHQVHTALHHPYQTGKVRFSSSDGWTLAPAEMDAPKDGEERLL